MVKPISGKYKNLCFEKPCSVSASEKPVAFSAFQIFLHFPFLQSLIFISPQISAFWVGSTFELNFIVGVGSLLELEACDEMGNFMVYGLLESGQGFLWPVQVLIVQKSYLCRASIGLIGPASSQRYPTFRRDCRIHRRKTFQEIFLGPAKEI